MGPLTPRGLRRPAVYVVLLLVAVFAAVLLTQGSPKGGPSIAAPGGGANAGSSSDANAGVSGDANANPVAAGNGVLVGRSYKNDRLAQPLRQTQAVPGKPREEEEDEQEPRKPADQRAVPDGGLGGQTQDQAAAANPQLPSSSLNFDGIGFPGVACNCAPPDTNGEVGLTQYVQIVNEGLQVFDKSTGSSVLGPVSIVTLWSNFGGVCQNNGDGDPVVLYDQMANRWLVSQFAGSNIPTDECVAVSTSSDATGTWNRYGFHLGSNFFDYPHLSVWPDGYYMSMNVFNSSGTAFLGPQPFAFDRTAMLAGNPATFVTTGLLSSGDDAILPADLDGSILPPAGAPDPFIMSGTLTTQRIYRMHVDFATPGNTTFTLATTLNPPAFTPPCTLTRACVPQPNGSRLDGLADRPMFRAAYRRFSDGHEALVGNQSVCVVNGGNCEQPGTAVVSIRWWEINNLTSGTPSIIQAATYQPDSTQRWMGSAAMDKFGNLAACYSVSSSTVVPGIRCAGRLSTDTPNTMGQGEQAMFAGAGSQTSTQNRWGDYSDLTVDPVDDCTFWFTSEYYPSGSTQFNWRTRIVRFAFPTCPTTPPPTPSPSATASTAPTGSPTTPPTASPTAVPTGTPGPTPTAGGPIAQLTGSAATCGQFSASTASSLNGLVYKANRSKITTVSPSTFRYWVRVSAAAGSNTFTVHQAITSGNFATVFGLTTGGDVFNTSCANGFAPTFSASSTNATNNNITVTFTAPVTGSYYVSVNLSTNSVKNKSVPNPTSVPYTFSTNGVTGSTASLSLHQ